MITQLSGTLLDKIPPMLIMDVNGVGYEVHAPMSTFYHLPELGAQITLLTHFVVREDAHLLFGFLSERERKLFRTLIKVNGVGPKLALTILSGIEPDDFVACIHAQDDARLTHIPGIGKKTAERLLVEMKDALSQWNAAAITPTQKEFAINPNQIIQDAISALISLGYKSQEAKNTVSKIHRPEHNSEQLIRLALQQIAQK